MCQGHGLRRLRRTLRIPTVAAPTLAVATASLTVAPTHDLRRHMRWRFLRQQRRVPGWRPRLAHRPVWCSGSVHFWHRLHRLWIALLLAALAAALSTALATAALATAALAAALTTASITTAAFTPALTPAALPAALAAALAAAAFSAAHPTGGSDCARRYCHLHHRR